MTGVRAETLEPSGFRFWLWASSSGVTLDKALTTLRCSSLIYKVRVVMVPALLWGGFNELMAHGVECWLQSLSVPDPRSSWGHWEDDKTLGIKVGSTIISPVEAPARSLS